MKINRKEMLEVLHSVQPGLDRSESVEQSNSFAFKGGKVYTFNDEIAVIADFKADFEGVVRAEELTKLLTKATEEEMEFIGKENQLKIKGKKVKAGILFDADIQLPIEEIGNPKKWKTLPDNFLQGVMLCIFSTATTGLSSVLGCIHVSGNTIESCDDFRLTEFEMDGEIDDSLLIPAGPAKHLVKNKVTEYSATEGWLHFRTPEGLRFACRTIEGDFPDLSELLTVSGNQITLPTDLKDMLDRAGIFISEEFGKNERVDIKIKKGYLTVHGEGPTGWFKERTKMKAKGNVTLDFAVQPQFLIQIVDLLDRVLVGSSRLLLKGENFRHVVSLLGD